MSFTTDTLERMRRLSELGDDFATEVLLREERHRSIPSQHISDAVNDLSKETDVNDRLRKAERVMTLVELSGGIWIRLNRLNGWRWGKVEKRPVHVKGLCSCVKDLLEMTLLDMTQYKSVFSGNRLVELGRAEILKSLCAGLLCKHCERMLRKGITRMTNA